MPTYEYKCPECGHIMETVSTMKDAKSEIECDQCHTMAGRYFSAAPAFDSHFEGSVRNYLEVWH